MVSTMCLECNKDYEVSRCEVCGKSLCGKCIWVLTYTIPGKQVLGVNTNTLQFSEVKKNLCKKCYEEYDPA
jgi:hypothetical protein